MKISSYSHHSPCHPAIHASKGCCCAGSRHLCSPCDHCLTAHCAAGAMCPPAHHRPGAMTTAAAARCAPRPRPAPRLARPSSRVGRGCGGAEAGAGPGLWRPPGRVVSGPNIARWPELGSAAGHQALFYLPTLHWHEECRNSFLVSHITLTSPIS